MSRHIGAKPKKEPVTIPAPAEPAPAEEPKKVTKRPRKTTKK